ncbi:stromal membrane-associated protein 1-like [Asbolus verrucosus]|uniref:Stromal membrane-associated protein 1-like n=1 Tax=Asbolus verrucosus TaxID=1661398 RepID=A0A482VR62_ASBVE|nr:stromal membrane-associated protein 1-like [Asbolus verrucosus]
MSAKTEKDKTKQLQDKCQSVLNDLLRDEDNKYCVDCDSKGPRWASWNIGVFLCIRCAGIHRNLGVHISKVKSVNLDTWTPEQVVSLQQMGNSRARAVYEANLPDNFRRPQNDSSLESFIRAKYEHKKYIAREWVAPTLPKVNWEKEIDDEIEKQKRKKKTTVEKKPIANVEVPQLPKPKNPSPKPGRVTVPETKKENDLLGLQNGEDSFSGFLSAPVNEEKKKDDEKSAKSEEESFFNQIVPTEKEKVKLTKDSILALYSNTQANNFNQFQQSQMPYQGNFPAQNFQSFGGFPQQQSFQMTPPVGQFVNAQWGQSQFAAQGQMPAAPVGQFPVASQFQNGASHFGSFQNNGQFGAAGQFAQFQQGFNPAQTPNPFFGNQNGLQQQFGNLTLSNQPTANAAPTLATNIWQ